MSSIGERIMRARLNGGYRSQAQLANAMGINRSLIGQWEAHHKMPGRENLAKIAKLCAVTTDYLLGNGALQQVMSLTINDPSEVKLVLAFRRMSLRQQQRLAEFVSEAVNARREVQHERKPS